MATRAEDMALARPTSSRSQLRFADFHTQGSLSWFTTVAPTRTDVRTFQVPVEQPSLQQRFDALVARWRNETSHVSQVERRVMHPSYQKIIALGPRALPLILRELEQRPDHWFWALNMLAPETPIPDDFQGTATEAAHLWITWGREAGYLDH